ncbi:hypothetical protein VZT92_023371 [Zoarces viviparus]|uniref:Uncharacterized protein n=1 Tax=Zoarces viviparus TaxID=48416 RepID=A0AAW1E788_ZOAVI
MDARCRGLREQPGAPSSDNNTGKYRENSPSTSEEETDGPGVWDGYPPKKEQRCGEFEEKRCLILKNIRGVLPGRMMVVMWCGGFGYMLDAVIVLGLLAA